MRILHVITGLGPGGAEHMLWRLIAATPQVEHLVFSLSGAGVLSQRMRDAGATLLGDDTTGLRSLRALRRSVLERRPDVIQGWMYHGNMAALLARSAAPGAAMYWNVRQSLTHKRFTKPATRALVRLQALCSRAPAGIIYNAASAARDHEAVGFSRRSRVIIPNGFDVDLFAPDPAARRAVRAALKLGDDRLAIGLIARFDPWKNHAGFFLMAKRIATLHPRATFVLAGKGIDDGNEELAAMVDGAGLRDRVVLLGDRRDVAELNVALDIACNVSHGEGFPNAVGEAMACATPCVVTPVGASAELVGDDGAIARSTAPADLVDAVDAVARLPDAERRALGARARRRILDHFSIDAVAQRYLALYATAGSGAGAG
ncbi:glycosyltransferase [Sphingomonas yunnanensis]|uniref:glycosyltransferase n=1 Tax=Sphingomonas yunnanensis TaxID=310400 RepID=UPI001CA758CE|nr:glycosyltransferase [Sphingomonas yunnanensis]MBY9063463.1 glycosyltransferase [Sphingomonas yunnanensis]